MGSGIEEIGGRQDALLYPKSRYLPGSCTCDTGLDNLRRRRGPFEIVPSRTVCSYSVSSFRFYDTRRNVGKERERTASDVQETVEVLGLVSRCFEIELDIEEILEISDAKTNGQNSPL
ncbi:hypothetical protein BofuT4_P017220.1 [Botrytis cinerea T4]|uniref:Uncharacterized protein n=1 Tax=Botryotinia fuckeliana (strain T4) TaxID=999810 RepID=G2YI79_BOTF4|nr:hypothetical protein BofuT4_P017220.1 [Botrytis cinerea T4]